MKAREIERIEWKKNSSCHFKYSEKRAVMHEGIDK
jgi:hypothetical protein